MAAVAKRPVKSDDFVDKMDQFANELMDKARSSDVSLQSGLDTFKELARWVGIKNRLGDLDGTGESLDEFRAKLRSSEAPPRSGAPRGANWAKRNSTPHIVGGQGGSALDAIRRKLPSANAGDDAGAGDDLEC